MDVALLALAYKTDRSLTDFLDELSMHALDLVLADAPAGVGSPLKLFNHLLGDCGTTIYGSPKVASSLKRGFPRSLDGARFLVPGVNAALRREIEQWFDIQSIRPQVVAEVDDSGLLQVLAASGHGVFAGPSVMEADARDHYGLRPVGTIPTLRQRFFAIPLDCEHFAATDRRARFGPSGRSGRFPRATQRRSHQLRIPRALHQGVTSERNLRSN